MNDERNGRAAVEPLLLRVGDVAKLLSANETTVKCLHRMGRLKGFLVGHALRWRRKDVLKFVDDLGSKKKR